MEGGDFLKQISLVYRDQRLFLSLSASSKARNQQQQRDTIQVIVQDISFTATKEPTSSPWPKLLPVADDDDEGSNTGAMARDDGDKKYLALLTSDTEIIVTPKPRQFDPSSWSEPLQVIPGSLDVASEIPAALKDRIPDLVPLYLAPPGCVVVHPSSIISWDSFIVGKSKWVQIASSADNSDTKRKVLVAQLVVSAELPETCTGAWMDGFLSNRKPGARELSFFFCDENRYLIVR